MTLNRTITVKLKDVIDIEKELRKICCTTAFYKKIVRPHFGQTTIWKTEELPMNSKQRLFLSFLGIKNVKAEDAGEYNRFTFSSDKREYITDNAE